MRNLLGNWSGGSSQQQQQPQSSRSNSRSSPGYNDDREGMRPLQMTNSDPFGSNYSNFSSPRRMQREEEPLRGLPERPQQSRNRDLSSRSRDQTYSDGRNSNDHRRPIQHEASSASSWLPSFLGGGADLSQGFRPLPRRPNESRPFPGIVSGPSNKEQGDPGCWERRQKQIGCCVIGILCIGLGAFAFQPRKPTWTVLDLKILKAQFPEFKGIDGMMDTLGGQESAIDMAMETTVQASNPNLIGAHALPGEYNIRYLNNTIGRARTKSLSIGPMNTIVLRVTVHVNHVPAQLGMQMLGDMQLHEMQLPIVVTGSVIAKVGALSVRTNIRCDLKTDCSKLPEKTEFTYKKCTYLYDLPDPKSLAEAEALEIQQNAQR